MNYGHRQSLYHAARAKEKVRAKKPLAETIGVVEEKRGHTKGAQNWGFLREGTRVQKMEKNGPTPVGDVGPEHCAKTTGGTKGAGRRESMGPGAENIMNAMRQEERGGGGGGKKMRMEGSRRKDEAGPAQNGREPTGTRRAHKKLRQRQTAKRPVFVVES